jgi:hypothetical protein
VYKDAYNSFPALKKPGTVISLHTDYLYGKISIPVPELPAEGNLAT